MTRRDLLERAEAMGWRIQWTKGGHLKLTHPKADAPVYISSSPSCPRALKNAEAMLRQVTAEEGEGKMSRRQDKPRKRRKRRRPLEPRFVMPSGAERHRAWKAGEYLA